MTTAKSSKKGIPNTGPIYYLSLANSEGACNSEIEKINTECGTDGGKSRRLAEASSLSNDKIGTVTSKVKTQLAGLERKI